VLDDVAQFFEDSFYAIMVLEIFPKRQPGSIAAFFLKVAVILRMYPYPGD